MNKSRKIFFVVASGGHDTDRHFHDTIQQQRSLQEIKSFLDDSDARELESRFRGGQFTAWGAVPGEGNARYWNNMEAGDYVLVYRGGRIIFAAEVALKIHNEKLAEHFWGRDNTGQTWEYMYLMVNPEAVNVPLSKLNPLLEYSENYFPRGFMAIQQEKADAFLKEYGDTLSILRRLEVGEEIEKVNPFKKEQEIILNEKIERAPTEHDEMQWRLIRLGHRARVDVWVPRNDQGKSYNGEAFRSQVLNEWQASIDVPQYVENIDVVWKYGYSIKSAFEIEHSTSVYSGILRLSDLRALTPNSVYPLFIVAARERRNKVFSELKRPTFDNPYLKLPEAIGFLSYDKVRELDESITTLDINLSSEFLLKESERV